MDYNENTLFDTVDIETTTVCNRKCYFCPNSIFDRGIHFMDETLFKKVVDELADLNCVKFLTPTFYGEPLIDPRLPKFLRYIREKMPKIEVQLYTNGDFLDNEMRERLKGLVNVYIMNKPQGYKPPHPLTSRGGLILEANAPIRKMCDRPAHILTIDWKGDVVMCCEDYMTKHTFGNLARETILDVWNKKEYYEVRKGLLDGKPMRDICEICFGVDTTWREKLK